MLMERKITMVLSILLLISCSHGGHSAKEKILVNTTYVHLLFSTEKECLEAQPDPEFFYNCHQQLDFYPDNIVEIMLSDIIWRGEYQTEKNTVILTFEPNYEIPDGEMRFEILNSKWLINIENRTLWKKVTDDSIWE